MKVTRKNNTNKVIAEAGDMYCADLIEAQQKRIELYEQALLASWPEGTVVAAFDYWNAARKEDK